QPVHLALDDAAGEIRSLRQRVLQVRPHSVSFEAPNPVAILPEIAELAARREPARAASAGAAGAITAQTILDLHVGGEVESAVTALNAGIPSGPARNREWRRLEGRSGWEIRRICTAHQGKRRYRCEQARSHRSHWIVLSWSRAKAREESVDQFPY